METTKIDEAKLAKLGTLDLKIGSHANPDDGMCAMEAVAWLAGEPHSAEPACACPTIRRAMIRLNDRMGVGPTADKLRNDLLRPLLPKIIGSRAPWPVMVKRAFVAANWAVRVFAPIELDARGHKDQAEKLRALEPITDRRTAENGQEAAAAAYAAASYAAAYDAAASYDAASYAAAAYDAAYAAASYDAAYAAASYAAAAAAAAYAGDARRKVYEDGVRMIEAMIACTE